MKSAEFFMVNQVAHACSVSRATILRLENDGLITPSFKDPDSGYRYYSVEDLMRVRMILSLRNSGFSSALIQKYLAQPDDVSPLIKEVEERIRIMTNTLNVLRQQSVASGACAVSRRTTRVTNYYENVREMPGGRKNVDGLMQETLREAIDAGMRLNLDATPIVLTDRTDILHGAYDLNNKYTYIACIPVMNKPGGRVIAHPAGDVMYTLWDGDDVTLIECMTRLVQAIRDEGLMPLGPIGLEMLTPGRMIGSPVSDEPSQELFRIGMPVMPG